MGNDSTKSVERTSRYRDESKEIVQKLLANNLVSESTEDAVHQLLDEGKPNVALRVALFEDPN